MAETEQTSAAERARQQAVGGRGAPPAPKPVTGAELFSMIPQVALFVLMWHSITAHQRSGDARGSTRREAAQVVAGEAASLEPVAAAGQTVEQRGSAGMGGVGVHVPEQADMAKFPVRYPMWNVGQKFELYVYLSGSDAALNYSTIKRDGLQVRDGGALLWHEQNLYLYSLKKSAPCF